MTVTQRPAPGPAAGPPVPAGPGRRGRWWTVLALVGAVLAVFAGATVLALVATGEEACACSPVPEPDDGALGPGAVTVEVAIEHSAFAEDAEDLTVVAGTEVRFVLDNRDPIGHELIVGPPEVHRRHEGGHEAAHPPRPGEVSVGPNSTAETTYTFEEPGEVEYACHLPGHYDYGMHGTITVVAA